MRKVIILKSVIASVMVWAMVLMPQTLLAQNQTKAPAKAEWVGDVPIMPQLVIEPGLGFAFDNPEGRIVTIYIKGQAHADDIMAYYRQALAPLGWTQLEARLWTRGREHLMIIKTATADLWKIALRPQ